MSLLTSREVCPPQTLVDEATIHLRIVMGRIHPGSRGERELTASHVVARLTERGHTPPAAEWAILQAIESGALEARRKSWGGVIQTSDGTIAGRRYASPGSLGPGSANTPTGGPCDWDSFDVVAMPKLWDQTKKIAAVESKAGNAKGRRRKKRPGRPSNEDADGSALVLHALVKHHKYESDGSVGNYEPATLKQLKELSGVSKQTCSIFLANKFGKPGYKQYAEACRNETIRGLLAKWQGDLPEQVKDLFAEEYGRTRHHD